MKTRVNQRTLTIFNFFTKFSSIGTALVSFAVLLGWMFNIAVLKGILPGLATMKPLTALGLLFAAAALWLEHSHERTTFKLVCAGIVAIIGGMVLLEYIFDLNIGIDLMLFSQRTLAEGGLHPGRPAPTTALCLLFLGAALLSIRHKFKALLPLFTIPILLISLLALVGYAYDVNALYRVEGYSSMAVHTALLLAFLALGVLSACPEHPFMAVLASELIGGVLVRRLLLVVILVPFILSWLQLRGQVLDWYDTQLGLALFATARIVVLVGLIYWGASLLNQTDLQRENTFNSLRESQEQLAAMIDSAMDSIISIDMEQKIVLFNTAAEQMFGHSGKDLIGQPLERLLPERYRAIHANHIRHFGETGVTTRAMGSLQSLSGVRANGEEFPIEASISQIEINGQKILTVILRDITKRQRAEQALRASQSELAALVNSAMDAIVSINAEQKITLFNASAERMFGYSANSLLGQPLDRLLPERYRAVHTEHTRRFGQPGVAPHEMGALRALNGKRANGEEFPIEATGISQIEVNGQKIFTVILRDITERKRAEESLRVAEIKYRIMVEHIPAIIYLSGADQSIGVNYVGPQIEALGFSQEEWIADSDLWLRQVHSNDKDFVTAKVRECEITGLPFDVEYRILTRNGEVRWLHDQARYVLDDTNGRRIYIQGFMQDITERRETYEKLYKSEARYLSLLDNMLEGCQIIGFDWRYLYVNESTVRQGHNTQESLLGKTMMEMYPGIEQTELFGVLRRCMEKHSSHRMENEFTYPDGSTSWFELSIQPMPEGIFILSNEITERKLAEREREAKLILQAKNAELDRFAYTVSHDLKSPLVTISGFLGFLKKDLVAGDMERVQNDMFHIEGAINKMRGLVSGVLELSRAGLVVDTREEVHLDVLTNEVIELLHAALATRNAKVNIQTDLPVVFADKVRLGQVIQNLIENAIKYSGNQPEPLIEFGMRENDSSGNPIFFLRDNGIGISPQHQEKIFSPFSQLDSKNEGSGVGLATVKRIIEAHGGRIWVESEVGHGSTFFFTLPSQPKPDSVI
jgi:PAS domain S-box-containing protein